MDRSHETIQPQIQNEPPLQGSDEASPLVANLKRTFRWFSNGTNRCKTMSFDSTCSLFRMANKLGLLFIYNAKVELGWNEA